MEGVETYGLIGDVHAHDANLEGVLEFFASLRVTRILCVGDVVDGVGDPDRCVALLEENGAQVVRGNHDRWLLTDTARMLPDAHRIDLVAPETAFFLRGLPTTRRFETAHGAILLCHGVGEDDMVFLNPEDQGYAIDSNLELGRLRKSDVRWAVGGHTHRAMDRDFGDLRFINPGTIAALPDATCAILEPATDTVTFYRIEPDAIVPYQLPRIG